MQNHAHPPLHLRHPYRHVVRVAAIAGALALTAGAAPAHAAGPTLQDALRIADDAMGAASPCYRQLRVTRDPELQWLGIDGAATGVDAYPDRPWITRTCDIALSPRLDRPGLEARRCDVTVHEGLHTAGRHHTTDPADIMAEGTGEWAPCHESHTPPRLTRRQLVGQRVTDSLPPGYAWRINCTPRVTICWARADGAKIRRYRIHGDRVAQLHRPA